MKKYSYLIFLLVFISLLKIGFLSPPPILAQDPVTCTYTYGAWSACNNEGFKTRTYYPSPTSCCPAIPPLAHEICSSTIASSTVPCDYTYGDWGPCGTSGCQYRPYTASPTSCFQLYFPNIYQTCTYSTTTCHYSYGAWSACVSGYQARPYSASPTGCYESPPPVISQSCTTSTSSTSTVPCDYTYGAWSACNANGYKTRSYTVSPTGCYSSSSPVTYQTCTYSTTTVPCSYTYSAWSSCSTSSDYQTRTLLTKYPTGCYIFDAPILSQKCYYTTSTIPCSYTYGEWSPCSTSSDYQTRTLLSKYPTGCYPTTSPIISQKCYSTATTSSSTVPCVYTYGEWTICSPNGYQTRTYSASPAGCYQSYAPNVYHTCTSTYATSTYPTSTSPCYYTYSAWSACKPEGYQVRTVSSRYPAGCNATESPKIKEECVYVAPPATSTITAPPISVPEIPACKYEYSVWSDCVSGQQTRMVIDRLPSECRDSIAPVLHQACKSAPPVAETAPPDMPAPVPQVVLVPQPVNEINFNGKTSEQWQKYYFGAEQCKQKDVCGGQADPDKDGLINDEEYRYGTNPKEADTDHDGYVDADEIQRGRNPLVANSEKTPDKMSFESPKEKGEVRQDLYRVQNVEMVKAEKEKKGLKITGKAMPNTYVTVYIYSDPIVLTVKTDAEGNWSYVLEKPLEEGEHEVYVAVTDNVGKIVAKSEPVAFVQTAEAAIVTNLPPIGAPDKNEVSPTKAWFKGNYSIFIVLGFLGLVIALSAIGLMRTGGKKPENQ